MNKIDEIDPCIQCEAKYIIDCKCVSVDINGKPEIPEKCWKKKFIKTIPKPYGNS
jgi:hypothetical protein